METVKIEVLPGGRKPEYENGLYKCFLSEDGEIPANTGGLVPIGVRIKIPNTHFINVFSKTLKSLGGVGDSDYRGPMYLIIFNNSSEPLKYKKGDQAGFFSLIKIRTPPIEMVE
ncbi:Deoxyuridine 5'-triphosphate nucleotidohydrolase [Nosema granulosis]|uniref:Deoxyuridine 5'-triphosphate nucleotidohydrolase n=1 Tax=Nosema granulosis TaxID=83296 RepID=A0A9P6H1N3_9MICR|nr:Deoxyuridine 5'-triphosphate nucleotidohydrolase [Nosema granulosis]